MIKETLNIEGMSCSHCIKSVEQQLAKLKLDKCIVTIGEVKIEYEQDLVTKHEIIAAIKNAGYDVKTLINKS